MKMEDIICAPGESAREAIPGNSRPGDLTHDRANSALPELTEDEKIDEAARRIMQRFKPAFMELAK